MINSLSFTKSPKVLDIYLRCLKKSSIFTIQLIFAKSADTISQRGELTEGTRQRVLVSSMPSKPTLNSIFVWSPRLVQVHYNFQ